MRMPKHATVVAYLALFVALGGTAYAATGGNFVLGHANHASRTTSLKNSGSGPALKLSTAKKTTAPLAVSNGTKIKHLNADELDGLSSGAFQRKAAPIDASNTSPNTDPAGSVGPWSFSLQCSASGPATLKITGPGNAIASTTNANNNSAGMTFVGTLEPIGAGFITTAVTDHQVSQTVFLQSGSTIAEAQLVMTANNGGLFENCLVIGGATLIAS
jgi:hypothetical protein